MSKYIDADTLIAEIERRRGGALKRQKNLEKTGQETVLNEMIAFELNKILSFITSLQQEHPNDVRAEIEEYYGEDLAFDDERTKAAYHFFSAGKAFELREYEEERKRHITGLLDNFQKGMKAGYEKAISELKEGKVECSPIIKEFIDKLFATGNAFNFGFGSKDIKQEQPEVDLEKEIDKYMYPIQSWEVQEEPFTSLEKCARYFYELGLNARKEE